MAFEIDSKSRLIAQHPNPPSPTFPGIDHLVCHDVYQVTEQIVIDLGPIALFLGAPPCGDLSKLRLLTRNGTQADRLRDLEVDDGVPRPGVNGPTGKVLRRLFLILSWVLKHNPDVEYFI